SWGLDYYNDGGPYYVATLNGTNWGRPVGIGGGISEFFVDQMNKSYGYGTDGMSLSPDGKIFIVACGEDYDGNLDLYFSSKRKGDWSYLKKMSISTSGDERSIFIAADGKTIYFASDAYGGFGGLDIYKATIDDNGNASDITNIGRPFNSPDDDYGLVITADGKKAYFVRDGDIYFADLQDDSPIAPGPSILISGTVTDCNSVPLEVGLQLVNSSNEQISVCKSSRGGNFIFSIPDQSGQFTIKNANDDVVETIDIVSNNDFQEIQITLTDCSDFNQRNNSSDNSNSYSSSNNSNTTTIKKIDSNTAPANITANSRNNNTSKPAVKMH
ncbi:MAG: PD40 domain-containing protein, partial [Bacteroidales bacterium]|nr:PD40 domain-containing protein [Bacteroidales bacterium]